VSLAQNLWQKFSQSCTWLWQHRTKAIGAIGMGFGYAYEHQDMLGNFVPVKRMALTMGIIGGMTFAVGLYNTFLVKRAP
jgi:hypothetical protein